MNLRDMNDNTAIAYAIMFNRKNTADILGLLSEDKCESLKEKQNSERV